MSANRDREFIADLKCIKSGMLYEGIPTNFKALTDTLRANIKEYYPINQVPDDIVFSLNSLEIRMTQAKEHLDSLADLLIEDITKRGA